MLVPIRMGASMTSRYKTFGEKKISAYFALDYEQSPFGYGVCVNRGETAKKQMEALA